MNKTPNPDQPITLDAIHELARQVADKTNSPSFANLTATLDRLYAIQDATLAWARTERLADDLAANRHAVARKIASADRPVPTDLLEELAAVDQALTQACTAENDAEAHLKDVARSILGCDVTAPGVQREVCTNMAPPNHTAHWRVWHRGHGCHLDETPPPKVTAPKRGADKGPRARPATKGVR